MIEPLFLKDGKLFVLDQRALPNKTILVGIKCAEDGFNAIRKMIVRGAPLIGITAMYSLALEARQTKKKDIFSHLEKAGEKLKSSRPTAVNLGFAVDHFLDYAKKNFNSPEFHSLALKEAVSFHKTAIRATKLIAENGARLIKKGSGILTYCNAGSLATTGYGTALGVIYEAFKRKKVKEVFVSETRPYFQGMRLTSLELQNAKIPFRIISDNTAGHLMSKGFIDAVVVGADRIASNGDTANKIGTFSAAVLAKYHKIPFFVAAPVSTIDFSLKNGNEIPIEERNDEELLSLFGRRIAPKNAKGLYYAFDVTPAALITAIITEKDAVSPVNAKKLKEVAGA